MRIHTRFLESARLIWLGAAVLVVTWTVSSSAAPYGVRCKEPLPIFTLGEKSNPTKAQEAALCSCIWETLGRWERETSQKFATGRESEVSWLHSNAFPARFGTALEKCGGMKL